MLSSMATADFSQITFDTDKVYYVVSALIIMWLLRKLLSSAERLPPGPPALPIIGHLHLLGSQPHRSLAQLAKRYGPLMSLRLGQRQCIVASSPEVAKEFLTTQDENFSSRPNTSQGNLLLYNRQDLAFQSNTANWRHLKKIFMVHILAARRLQGFEPARQEEVAFMLQNIQKTCSYHVVEVKAHLEVLMLNTISYMVLKKRIAGNRHQTEADQLQANALLDMIKEHFRLAGLFVPGDFIPALKWLDLQSCEARMKKLSKNLDAVVTEIISEHRERRKGGTVPEKDKDVVDELLNLQDSKDGDQISEDAFLGATDTMSVTCEWAITELVRNPATMAKAHAELDAVVGHDRMVRESDIHRLPYIQAITKETFRLHPAGPLLIPHESTNACKAFGYNIPAKTRLIVNVWAIGRDSCAWEDPLEFNPDRFLKEEFAQKGIRGLDFELLPFGSGRRMCPAMPFADGLVHFVVASLLHAFHWSLPGGMNPKHLDMSDACGLTLPKATPLQIVAKPRLVPQLYA